jgi:hypothetical protein
VRDLALGELGAEMVLMRAWNDGRPMGHAASPAGVIGGPDPDARTSDELRLIPIKTGSASPGEPACQSSPFAARLAAILLAGGFCSRGVTRSAGKNPRAKYWHTATRFPGFRPGTV